MQQKTCLYLRFSSAGVERPRPQTCPGSFFPPSTGCSLRRLLWIRTTCPSIQPAFRKDGAGVRWSSSSSRRPWEVHRARSLRFMQELRIETSAWFKGFERSARPLSCRSSMPVRVNSLPGTRKTEASPQCPFSRRAGEPKPNLLPVLDTGQRRNPCRKSPTRLR